MSRRLHLLNWCVSPFKLRLVSVEGCRENLFIFFFNLVHVLHMHLFLDDWLV